jgi:L-asparaginase II
LKPAPPPNIIQTSQPIFAFARRKIPEVVVSGLVHVKSQGQAVEGSAQHTQIVSRSLLKPWQFLATDVAGEEDYWSLGLSSHSCQDIHLEKLAELSKAANAGEQELFCPRSYPLDGLTAARQKLSGEGPMRLHHPCSGKHLVMIAGCRKLGMDIDHYLDSEHPMQKRVQNIVGQYLDEKPNWVTDSCGLPTLAASVRTQLTMWERMAISDDVDAVHMKQLWTRNPLLVGGRDRLDSLIMQIGKGELLAKEGADGLLLVQSLPESGEPTFGVLIKLASGYNSSYLTLALWSVLSKRKDLPKPFERLTDYLRSNLEKWVPGDQSLLIGPF